MRRILAIVDGDAEYGRRLAAWVNEHGTAGFKATAFSDLSVYRTFRMSFLTEILLKIYQAIGTNWERAGNIR